MTADAELAGTVEYADGWLILAVVLVAAALAWNVGVLVWGRPRRLPRETPATTNPTALRALYLAVIDQVEAEHASGSIDSREAHQRLSSASRGFVQELTGHRTLSMTLRDLRARDLVALVSVVELAYPPVFAPPRERPSVDVGAAVAHARAAVRSAWS